MSRVITVGHCVECPHNEASYVPAYSERCKLEGKLINLEDDGFPEWCPLPESKEESNAKG